MCWLLSTQVPRDHLFLRVLRGPAGCGERPPHLPLLLRRGDRLQLQHRPGSALRQHLGDPWASGASQGEGKSLWDKHPKAAVGCSSGLGFAEALGM